MNSAFDPADIRAGDVVRYPYLWAREAVRGETAGRKHRPSAVAFRYVHRGEDRVFLLPITASEPEPGRAAYELPEIEVRRIGRGDVGRLWVVLDEANIERVHGSHYIEPDSLVGRLSGVAMEQIRAGVAASRRQLRQVTRLD